MRNNWFDFIDAILCQGGVDISSLFTEEKENNTNKVTVRKASKEEVEQLELSKKVKNEEVIKLSFGISGYIANFGLREKSNKTISDKGYLSGSGKQ